MSGSPTTSVGAVRQRLYVTRNPLQLQEVNLPIELGIWRISGVMERIRPSGLDTEARLEEFLEADPSLLDPEILILGRQVTTAYGKSIDLLGVDREGEVVVIELKRHRTPRDVVAQLLDYGSWVRSLNHAQVTAIYEDYASQISDAPDRFETAFSNTFAESPPDALNESHRLVVVASELDPSTERIVDYLVDEFGVPINAVFFQVFKDGESEYITRTWLRDPQEIQSVASSARGGRAKREPWNGRDFYVAFGEDHRRTWADAIEYGFVSAGGGRRYSGKLDSLFEGARVFVHIPGAGYVGVGTVTGEATPVTEFKVEHEGQNRLLSELPLQAENVTQQASDPENQEYFVPIEWEDTVARSDAVWEKGMFANQNIVCKLRNRFTRDRLAEYFDWAD